MEKLALKDSNKDKYIQKASKEEKKRVQRLSNIYVAMFFNKEGTQSSESI